MKTFSYLLTILGGLSTVFGLIPILFLYPDKPVKISWHWIVFQDSNRWFWQIGLIALIVGITLIRKQRR